MDTCQPSSSTSPKSDAAIEPNSKKSSLENLSQEELVKKCRSLLALAHKAKIAKDEHVEENRLLKEEISKYETQKDADKKSLMAMKEIVESLTENKLQLITKLENLESQTRIWETEYKKNQEDMSQLSIENESLKRQIQRLTDENDALLTDLDNLENKLEKVNNFGVQQQKDLVLLEEAADKWKQFENKAKELKAKLDTVNKENNILTNDKLEQEQKLKDLMEINTTQAERIDRFKSRLLDVSKKLKKLKECKSILLETQNDYAKSITKWQKEIIDASKHIYRHIEKLETENKVLKEKVYENKGTCNTDMLIKKINSLKANCFEITKKYDKCNMYLEKILREFKDLTELLEVNTKKIEESEKARNLLQHDFDQLKIKNNNNLAEINRLNSIQTRYDEQHELLKSIQFENSNLLKTNSNSPDTFLLQEKILNLTDLLSQKTNEIQALEGLVENKEMKNKELLSEMREINEVLKGRGDLISRQQQKLTELEAEVKRTGDSLIKIENNLTRKESLIYEKEIQITKMNEEISKAKSQVESLSQQTKTNEIIIKNFTDEIAAFKKCNDTFETQSETMSNSTISRVEEINRIREVDDSLEDKYTKLRSFAIKLKKKVQEQSKQLSNYENDIKKNDSVLQVKNLQILQNENDNLLDEIENYKKMNDDKTKCIAELNEKYGNLTILHEEQKLNKEKCNSQKDLLIKELEKQVKLLTQEKDSFNLARKEIEKELEIVKKTLTTKQNELSSVTKQLNKTKSDLDKSRATSKQSNVLNLEIEAFEKSLNETTEKLNSKVVQLKECESILKDKDTKIESLKKQINILEESLISEKNHSSELKNQLDLHHEKYKQSEFDKKVLSNKIDDLRNECDTYKMEIHTLQIQIADAAKENDKLYVTLKNEKDKLMRQVVELEESKENLCEQLKTVERSLDDLQNEYINYKLKAQSVLRQNQTKESSRERELEEELTSTQTQIQLLNTKNESYVENLENNERKLDDLREENERIQKRCKALIELLEESRLQNDSLLEDNRKLNTSYQESLKNHRLQIDTINSCYKKQIHDIEKKNSQLLEETKLNNQIKETPVLRVNPYGGSKSIDEQKIDLILMEREDAEGSETTTTLPRRKSFSNNRSKHDLIPLDELLNSSFDTNFKENTVDDDHNLISSSASQMSIDLLQAQESRIRHLTILLSETEQDLSKHIQLNDLLKEEVRRHERGVEREKHMHNSEYLKNVVLKFITLNNGDERVRLVPVLNTILKLSPDEVSTLQMVAKGKAADSQNRSWGTFLQPWSNNNA